MATVLNTFQTGNHAGRPTSGVAYGALYACTTHSLIYQTTDGGGTWVTWATLGTTETRASLGLATSDTPQFAGIEVGHASDTTLARASAGNLTVEGNALYRAGGTDVALADGGTGASLTDPNADRIMFWDDSAGEVTWLTAGTGLTISTTTISASGSFDADNNMPWRIDINPILGMSLNTGFSIVDISSTQWARFGMQSTAQNDEIGCDVILAAGTWSVHLLFYRFTNRGIATVSFAGSDVGTIDTYGSDAANITGSITGISVGSTGKSAFKIKAATKNGSSSGYGLWLSWIALVRTA